MEVVLALLSLGVLICLFVYSWNNATKTQNKQKQNTEIYYFEGHPVRRIEHADGTIETISGSGHTVNPYEAYFSGINKLEKPCPEELLTPKDTNVSFYFNENKTKNFTALLELLKDNKTLNKTDDGYNVTIQMNNWKNVKDVSDIVKKWKNSKILLGGKDVEKLLFAKMLRCLENKSTSRTQKWCDDFYFERNYPQCIGCRCLGISTLFFDEFLEERDNYFRIKKEDVLKIIQENAQTLKFCPFWDANKIWKHYLKLIPAVSFNDKRFVCIKENDKIRIEIRHDLYQPLSSIREYTPGKILSKK